MGLLPEATARTAAIRTSFRTFCWLRPVAPPVREYIRGRRHVCADVESAETRGSRRALGNYDGFDEGTQTRPGVGESERE